MTFGVAWQDVNISMQAFSANVILTRVSSPVYTYALEAAHDMKRTFSSIQICVENETKCLLSYLPLICVTKTLPRITLVIVFSHVSIISITNPLLKMRIGTQGMKISIFVCNFFVVVV